MSKQREITVSGGFFLPKIRKGVQVLMLAVLGQWAFYGIFRCPFLIPFVGCHVCPVITCRGRVTGYFWAVWLSIPVSTLFVGRAFCSWFCPGGVVNQVFGKISLSKLRVRNRIMRLAPLGMAVSLAVVAIIFFVMDNPRMMIPIRTGEFLDSIRLSFEHASSYWLIRTFVVLGLTAAGLFVANLWCRFACPTGGLLEFFKGLSLFRIYKTDACSGCNACLQICEMDTRPDEVNCTNCGDCLKICPEDAINFGRKRRIFGNLSGESVKVQKKGECR